MPSLQEALGAKPKDSRADGVPTFLVNDYGLAPDPASHDQVSHQLHAAGMRTIILDLRRVTEIDATGARILGDIQASLAGKNQHLALAKNSETAACLSDAGIIETIGAGCVFEDIDRAMESPT